MVIQKGYCCAHIDVVMQKEVLEAHSMKKNRKMMLIMSCMHCIKQINAAIAKKAIDIYSPPPGDIPHGIEELLFPIQKAQSSLHLTCNALIGEILFHYILCGR
jgi:hypothetical protein